MRNLQGLCRGLVALILFGVCQSAWAGQFFGYWGVGLNVPTNVTTAWIGYDGYPHHAAVALAALPAGTNAVLDVHCLFFETNDCFPKEIPSGVMRASAAAGAAWKGMLAAITPYSGKIVAFYLADEPNGYLSRNPLIPEVRAAAALIHESFPWPQTAVMSVMGQYGIFNDTDSAGNTGLVKIFDWIGFDCYANGSMMCHACPPAPGDAVCERTTRATVSNCCYLPYYQILAALEGVARQDARIVLVPQVNVAGGNRSANVQALFKENLAAYNRAMTDPKVVAIFPFGYNNYASNGKVGLKDVPELKGKIDEIALAIKEGRTPRF